jgi:hypothetical protein
MGNTWLIFVIALVIAAITVGVILILTRRHAASMRKNNSSGHEGLDFLNQHEEYLKRVVERAEASRTKEN